MEPMMSNLKNTLALSAALLAGAATLAVDAPEAHAQEIQLTGPLAGAPAAGRRQTPGRGRDQGAPGRRHAGRRP